MKSVLTVVALVFSLTTPPTALAQSRVVEASLETEIVPGPVEYAVLLPNGYSEDSDRLPLVLNLHGGGGDRGFLAQMRPLFDELWADGSLPSVVVATPSVGNSEYMNNRSGTERWEDFDLGELISHRKLFMSIQLSQCVTSESPHYFLIMAGDVQGTPEHFERG